MKRKAATGNISNTDLLNTIQVKNKKLGEYTERNLEI
jgi:hypothetical protein